MMENYHSSSDDGGGPFIPVKSPLPSKKKNNQVGNTIKMKPEFTLAVWAHFPYSLSFNPVAHAKALFGHLVAADSDAVICILSDESEDSEPSLLSPDTAFPSLEANFKKYFKVYEDKKVTKKLKVVITFTVATSRLLNDIKFDPDQTILLNWLKEEKIFLECDNLRLDKIAYAGYFIQNSPCIFHHASHKAQIKSILHLIEMTDEDAVAHDEEQRLHAIKLANKGEPFSVQVLDFELELCKLGYGKDTAQVLTDAIRIKCLVLQIKLVQKHMSILLLLRTSTLLKQQLSQSEACPMMPLKLQFPSWRMDILQKLVTSSSLKSGVKVSNQPISRTSIYLWSRKSTKWKLVSGLTTIWNLCSCNTFLRMRYYLR